LPADQELKDQIVDEYIKCADNPEYFLRNYVYIQHQELGRILFDLYDFQERSLEEIRRHRYNIILKARQMGISTLVAGYSLWMALFNNETKILVVSMKRAVAKNLVQKAKFAHDNLPVWMREEKVEDNKTSIGLSNGSKIFAESTSGDAGRSESLSMLIIDEGAFIDDVDELWSAAKPTLDVGNGRAIVLSTPSNIGSWFHQQWSQAISGAQKIKEGPDEWEGIGKNNFHPIKLHWSLHPNRDSEWRQEQDTTLGPDKAARECFSGDTKIYTSEGPTSIKEVSVGDEVLTHKGRYKPVKRTFNKKGSTWKFNTDKNKTYRRITPDHPVLNSNKEWEQFGILEKNEKDLTEFPVYAKNPKQGLASKFTECSLDDVTKDYKKKKVYNLEVKEDHSYVTEHFVAHNCDCDFSSSGDNVVDTGVLEWYEENTVEEPKEKRLVRGSDDLWVWEEPEPSGNYVLSADVARGDGDDFSTFHVFSVEDLDQKMEFQGKITPETFANQIYTQASYYNDALVVVERNSFGRSVLQELIDRGYRNILYTSNDLSLVDIRKTRDINEGRKTKPGLDTNRKTRPLIISRMKEFMRNKHCNIKSSRLIEEFRTFVWKGDKPQHMPGYNDDLVMAAAFGIWVRDSALKYQDQLNDVTKKTLERFSTGKGLYTSKGKSEDPYTVSQDGKKHDIRWLFE